MRYLAPLASIFLAAACVGQPPSDPGNGGDDDVNEPDAGGNNGGADAAGGGDVCIEPAVNNASGRHNVGADCSSCHPSAPGAPPWTIAGTVFTEDGQTGLAGATLVIKDSTGKELELVTAQNGNFYTLEAMTPPFTINASRCPDSATMPGTAPTGACNTCHSAGSQIGRIKLPN